jgi:hypothetical protein
MGTLLELARRLTAVAVLPVPSLKKLREPLEPSLLLVVPSYPPVPPKSYVVEEIDLRSVTDPLFNTLTQTTSKSTERPAITQHIHLSADTASPTWRHARDMYINHLMTCRSCHAPKDRYCAAGAELRNRYNATPLGASPVEANRPAC